MKQRNFGKRLKLNKATVADLLKDGMEKVKGGTEFNWNHVRTYTCQDTVCQLSCQCTVTKCQSECPSGGVPCNYC